MNARWLLNLCLLLAVVIAGTMLFFKPRQASHEGHRLIPAAEPLQEIIIERGDQPPIRLARAAGDWRMEAPVAARIDDTALARLIDLTRVEVSSRLPAVDLDRYALDKPWARVSFGRHRIAFGMTNALTHELYARSGEHVYAIPARLAAAVPATAAKLLAHRMFAPDETPSSFRLEAYSLRHDGVRWQLDPPDPGLSQDDLVRWVDQWRLASSTLTQPATKAVARESVRVELSTSREIELRIVSRTPDLVVQRADEGLEYHFASRMASLLLASPSEVAATQR